MALIHYAVDRGHGDIVQYLTTLPGIDLNSQDMDGQSCLHIGMFLGFATTRTDHVAACTDNLEIARILISAGAKTDLVDQNGDKPVDYLDADTKEKDEWIKLLSNKD